MMDSPNLILVVKLQEVIFQYLKEQCFPESDLVHVGLFLNNLKQHAFGFENHLKESNYENNLLTKINPTTSPEGDVGAQESSESIEFFKEVAKAPLTSEEEPVEALTSQHFQEQSLPESDLVDADLNNLKQHAFSFEDVKTESNYKDNFEDRIENQDSEEYFETLEEDEAHFETSQEQGIKDEGICDQKSGLINEIIRCSFCEIDFKTREDANKHDNESHILNGKMKCTMCDVFENDKKIMVKHFLKTHKKIPCFDCNDCDEFFLSLDELRPHMAKVHNIRVKGRTCVLCSKTIKHDKLRLHMFKEHLSMEFPCNGCKKTFNNPMALKNHTKIMHKLKRKPCNICNKEILEKVYDKHIETHQRHEAVNTVKCTECDKMYFSELYMNRHRKECHSTNLKIRNCTECDYSTTRRSSIHRHIMSHSKEKNFKCDQCDLSFKNQYSVRSHKKKVHVGARDYKCEYCPKAFKGPGALKRHVDIHVENYQAQCEICDKKFVQRGNYWLHLRKKHNILNGPVNSEAK